MTTQNSIKPNGKKVEIILDPNFVIMQPAFTPRGNSIGPSGYTVGQAIQGLATVLLATKAPQLMKDFPCARICFEKGKFAITLYENNEDWEKDEAAKYKSPAHV